jgi:hypothetical protein
MAKRSGSKHNKKSKRNTTRREASKRNRTLSGGKDRGSPTKNPTSKASISRELFNELVERNRQRLRLERERLAQEHARLAQERARLAQEQERERLAQEQQRRNNIFGSQQLPQGQTALATLFGP